MRKPSEWKRYYSPAKAMWIVSPLIRSEWLSNFLNNEGVVQLKMEAMQPSGSFKIRGISKCMQKMGATCKGLDAFVTTSSANAAIATAYVAREMGEKCRVILDESQRDNKLIPVMKSHYGAEVEFKGSTWNEADQYARKLCSKSAGKLQYVPMVSVHSFLCLLCVPLLFL